MSRLTTYLDTSQFGTIKVSHGDGQEPLIQRAKMSTVALLRKFNRVDIDEFRAKFGKEEGEARFFHDYQPDEVHVRKDNLFMYNGAALLWQCALGNGTGTANTALPTPTYINNSNSYLYVGDGNYLSNAITGTVSINNSSTSLTTSSGSSGLVIGNNLVIATDTSSQTYTIASGSGTSWTISPAFGGSNVSTVAAYQITPTNHTQTALTATTNIANQVADSTFPSNGSATQFNAISAASNATPVVLTVSGGDVAANDIVSVNEVLGNLGANGVFVANPASSSSITLVGSVGTGAYTSGGYVTKRNVIVMQSTFGSSSAVFTWYEWGFFNGNSSNKIMLNRRVVGLGSKASGVSSALKIGIAIS